MLDRLFGRRIKSPAGLFNGAFFDVRTAYVLVYDKLPSVSAIGDIDGNRAYAFLMERFGGAIRAAWQHSLFEFDDNEIVFARSIFQLDAERMIEIGPNYVEVLHNGDFAWANGLLKALAAFRNVPKEAPIGFARSGSMN